MSLRARMGVAAGVAVAIAVIAVAFSAYAGTRSQLTGQLDTQLQRLTSRRDSSRPRGAQRRVPPAMAAVRSVRRPDGDRLGRAAGGRRRGPQP